MTPLSSHSLFKWKMLSLLMMCVTVSLHREVSLPVRVSVLSAVFALSSLFLNCGHQLSS